MWLWICSAYRLLLSAYPLRRRRSDENGGTGCELNRWQLVTVSILSRANNELQASPCRTFYCFIIRRRRVIKSWLTPRDRATRCVTPSRHRAVHKVGRWVWSTSDGRRSTVDNTWRRSTCRRVIMLSSEVAEKLQRELCSCLEIFEFRTCFINIFQFQGVCPLDQKLWIQWRHDPRPYALARSPVHAMIV